MMETLNNNMIINEFLSVEKSSPIYIILNISFHFNIINILLNKIKSFNTSIFTLIMI